MLIMFSPYRKKYIFKPQYIKKENRIVKAGLRTDSKIRNMIIEDILIPMNAVFKLGRLSDALTDLKDSKDYDHDYYLRSAMRELTRTYVSDDNGASYGYEYIDIDDSNSEMLVIDVPHVLDVVFEDTDRKDPLTVAVMAYNKVNKPSDDEIINTVANLIDIIDRRNESSTQEKLYALHKDTRPTTHLIEQLSRTSQTIDAEIKALTEENASHLKANAEILNTAKECGVL